RAGAGVEGQSCVHAAGVALEVVEVVGEDAATGPLRAGRNVRRLQLPGQPPAAFDVGFVVLGDVDLRRPAAAGDRGGDVERLQWHDGGGRFRGEPVGVPLPELLGPGRRG